MFICMHSISSHQVQLVQVRFRSCLNPTKKKGLERDITPNIFLEELMSVLEIQHGISEFKPHTTYYCSIKCISDHV